jgi:hypothetical protein
MLETSELGTSEVVFDAPPPVSEEEMRNERPARLLETGEYADKSLTVTEDDLDAIVSRFTAGLPVKVEHLDSPLDPLGRVVRVWREGNALMGMLAFPDDLAGFLRRRGAAKLSVGLTREPLALKEVSLVLKPRVASAAFLSAESLHAENLNAEIVRLRAALTAREVDAQITALKAQGRVVPASEAAARALLGTEGGEIIRMAGGYETVASAFRRFLEAQPPVVQFGETVPAGGDFDGFTQYEHTFLSNRLGVNPKDVAALLENEQKEKIHAH